MNGTHGELLGPVRREHQQRPGHGIARELGDDLERQLVRPVHVLEDQERGPVDRVDEHVGDLVDEDPAGRQGVAALAAARREEPLGEVTEVGLLHRPGHVADGHERDELVLGVDIAFRIPESGLAGLAYDGADDPGLADPGLARDQDGRAAANSGFAGLPRHRRKHRIAADEDGAEEHSARGHAPESRAPNVPVHRSDDRCARPQTVAVADVA